MTEVPRSVSLDELERLVATVGERDGWDLSRVRMERDPIPWGYNEVVRRYLRPQHRVLDVGTGGGERFLSLADAFGEGIGVDENPAMIDAARRNLPSTLSGRIRFALTARDSLAFDPESFDVVLNRHGGVFPEPVVRVIRPGGWFIFQGIGHRKDVQLCDAFGWDRGYLRRRAEAEGNRPVGMDQLIAAFEQLDCEVVVTGDEHNRAWFCDLESLVFYLKSVPLPETFDPGRHLEPFNRYLAANAGPKGYEATEHGELLIVRKHA